MNISILHNIFAELLGHIHVQADQYSLQYPTQLDSLYSTLLVESKSLEGKL